MVPVLRIWRVRISVLGFVSSAVPALLSLLPEIASAGVVLPAWIVFSEIRYVLAFALVPVLALFAGPSASGCARGCAALAPVETRARQPPLMKSSALRLRVWIGGQRAQRDSKRLHFTDLKLLSRDQAGVRYRMRWGEVPAARGLLH